MKELERYEFEGHSIRCTAGPDGEPWFVAKDICDALGIRNVAMVVKRLAEDQRADVTLNDGSQGRTFIIVSESGMYRIIARSDKPAADPLMEWLTRDVLPSIRKTGRYVAAATEPVKSAADMFMIAAQTFAAQELRLGQLEQSDRSRQAEIAEVAARLDAQEGRHDYYAALGWAKMTGFQPTDDVTLARLGRIAVSVAAAAGVEKGTAPHAHYGQVNTYPRHVWEEAARLWRARQSG